MPLYIDIHALQTLPPNNINRDDTGSPKSALFGGVPRQRVSSQAFKRAIRKDFERHLPAEQLGVRTKRVVEQIARRALELQGVAQEEMELDAHSDALRTAAEAAEALLSAAGFKPEKRRPKRKSAAGQGEAAEDGFAEMSYLMFLSDRQITRAAEEINRDPACKWTKKQAAALLDDSHSVDIAMFGRMLADAKDFNVDASVQVAHAIGVSASEPEFDYYTAVDDAVEDTEESGAGMIGTVAFTSSTLYRYANVNVPALVENLGDAEVAMAAVEAFVQAFITALPSGKQNSFAGTTLPDVVAVALREDRPVSWVNAFEDPVPTEVDGGRRREAARRLAAQARDLDGMYGATALGSWVVAPESWSDVVDGLGERVDHAELTARLRAALEERR